METVGEVEIRQFFILAGIHDSFIAAFRGELMDPVDHLLEELVGLSCPMDAIYEAFVEADKKVGRPMAKASFDQIVEAHTAQIRSGLHETYEVLINICRQLAS